MGRTFEAAITLLKSRVAPRSVSIPQPAPTKCLLPKGDPTFRGTPHIFRMREWLQKLGHDDAKIDKLQVIHVAGTKGKGSTCAYMESFLRQHGTRTEYPKKTGLYTSPHLLEVTERIRINFVPLEKARFAENFFEVWERLDLERLDLSVDDHGPRQLQIICLMAFHTFLKECVDVAILETHHGGEYDVTNIVRNPLVTVITHIGLDHVIELGPSIENIAWHKAGIFKSGATAFSCEQEPSVITQVLNDRARQKGVTIQYVSSRLPEASSVQVLQKNAYLAKTAADSFLWQTRGRILSAEDIKAGIDNFSWPGRFHRVIRGDLTWCLDCAHTACSVTEAATWFNELLPSDRYVLFTTPNSITANTICKT
ncbi:hypothetical protein S40288_10038 [Stachybotrys chartarum IBT 40288]|nr:hypothetical protein S40288_10038 [Stachybotrys chartarum IBT 40288]